MSVRHFRNHVVQTDENYQIRNHDKIVIATAANLNLILPIPRHIGHQVTVVAANGSVVVLADSQRFTLRSGRSAVFTFTDEANPLTFAMWQIAVGVMLRDLPPTPIPPSQNPRLEATLEDPLNIAPGDSVPFTTIDSLGFATDPGLFEFRPFSDGAYQFDYYVRGFAFVVDDDFLTPMEFAIFKNGFILPQTHYASAPIPDNPSSISASGNTRFFANDRITLRNITNNGTESVRLSSVGTSVVASLALTRLPQ